MISYALVQWHKIRTVIRCCRWHQTTEKVTKIKYEQLSLTAMTTKLNVNSVDWVDIFECVMQAKAKSTFANKHHSHYTITHPAQNSIEDVFNPMLKVALHVCYVWKGPEQSQSHSSREKTWLFFFHPAFAAFVHYTNHCNRCCYSRNSTKYMRYLFLVGISLWLQLPVVNYKKNGIVQQFLRNCA